MAVRTTSVLVSELLEVDASDVITQHIATANLMVDRYCLESEYTEAHLTLIESWLAAHFYTVSRPQNKAEKVDVLSESKDIQTALQLQSSRFGQTAMALDFDGNLAAASKRSEEGNVRRDVSVWSLATNPDTSEHDALRDDR